MADVAYLRNQAAACRDLAAKVDDTDEADDLINLALVYEQVARRYEAAERQHSSTPVGVG
ncbi:MAG: hypothetical protein M3177_06090 [Pseudomonadota bacterium]|nr:hypothetical protein [Pseudomonadota bacterium]